MKPMNVQENCVFYSESTKISKILLVSMRFNFFREYAKLAYHCIDRRSKSEYRDGTTHDTNARSVNMANEAESHEILDPNKEKHS